MIISDLSVHVLDDMFRLCRARSSGSVGTRCRDRNTCEIDQAICHRIHRHTDRNGIKTAGGSVRYDVLFRKIMVSGPGQYFSASFRPASGISFTIAGSSSIQEIWAISGLSDGRPLPRRSSLPLPHSTRWHQGRKRSPSGTPQRPPFSRSQPPLKSPGFFSSVSLVFSSSLIRTHFLYSCSALSILLLKCPENLCFFYTVSHFTLMRRYRCGLPRNDKGAA